LRNIRIYQCFLNPLSFCGKFNANTRGEIGEHGEFTGISESIFRAFLMDVLPQYEKYIGLSEDFYMGR